MDSSKAQFANDLVFGGKNMRYIHRIISPTLEFLESFLFKDVIVANYIETGGGEFFTYLRMDAIMS